MNRLVVKPLGALGALGQNTQTTNIDLPPEFAKAAVNCQVDQSGRLTSRYAAVGITTDNGALADGDLVQRVYRHNKADGTSALISCTSAVIVAGTTALTTTLLTNASAGLYQFASLNGVLFAAQAGEDFKAFTEAAWVASTIATPAQPIAIHSAFGRLWAISADGWTLHWSDLLGGTDFTTGASGSLDLNRLHTAIRTPAVAVASFNRQIVVLCRDSLILLGLANDLNPNDTTTPIFLQDSVPGIGCIARDTVISTGDDLLFLADDGVRSLRRSMAEKQGPAPLSDVSAFNTDVLLRNAAAESNSTAISACWNPQESWYQVFFPTTKEIWNFDLAQRIPQSDIPRCTVWAMVDRPLYHGVYWTDDLMRYGGNGGIYTVAGYDGTGSYTMTVETGWLSLETPDTLKHFKKLLLNLRGGGAQAGRVKWAVDFDESSYRTALFTLHGSQVASEFGTAEYGTSEFSTGLGAGDLYIHLSGSAKFIKFVLEVPVSGYEVTLNNAQIYFNQGRVR